MKTKDIVINNASEHNLKNISTKIPRRSLTVITGISGSGKSSLAFDTIYAEGNRRYVESLSIYARQFIDLIKKPEVENIEGLSPAIAINQRTISSNPRSTVGTITEIYDYLRLLYAKLGKPYCYKCNKPFGAKNTSEVVNDYNKLPENTKLTIMAPLIKGKKGEHSALLQKLASEGYSKVQIDSKLYDLNEEIKLDKKKTHEIDLVVDRIIINKNSSNRLNSSIELALKLSKGTVKIKENEKKPVIISNQNLCIECGVSYPEIEPRTFSFNSPYGACPVCNGLGYLQINEEKIKQCSECSGSRLRKESLNIKVNKKSIYELSEKSITELKKEILLMNFDNNEQLIAKKIIREIEERLDFIIDVGLGYLSLNRTGASLSGGEAQRIRLATQLGCGLTGVLYILDEPSIGLHPRDNKKLISALLKLRDKGNTVIVVEHDEDTIRSADHIIDLGPGAGTYGGKIVAEGNFNNVISNQKSLTGLYLSSSIKIPVPKKRKALSNKKLVIKNINTHNLKNISVSIPVGLITTVTGISGSGKSSLIMDSLLPLMIEEKKNINIEGKVFFEKTISIDQSPIGQTPRSNPATYIGLYSQIRELFSMLPESKARAYNSGRFSFNIAGGRCEACQGQGQIKIEMKFMPDVFISCQTCEGKKFNSDTLEIKYKGKNISEVLDMTVEEALIFFKNIKYLYNKLKVLHDVGLGYIKLGQSSVTLSGGEAQRIKLSKELVKKSSGKNLYILDEPTTGLHFDDVKKLINMLYKLRDQGNTIIIIEHNLEVIKTSDYIIDLGPEGGEAGGYVVASGTPEELVLSKESFTGTYLKQKLRSI